MNIFYLDHDPRLCAEYHCDQHVRKMMLEYAQILSTVHHRMAQFKSRENDKLYRPTHQKHPSVLWAMATMAHYDYLYLLWVNLHDEYIHRFGKKHRSYMDLNQFLSEAPFNYTNIEFSFTPPPQVMPEEYQDQYTVAAYRRYYVHDKSRFASWTNRSVPGWYLGGIIQHGYGFPKNIRTEGNVATS